MNAQFIRNNLVLISIVIFIILFVGIHYIKPDFLFNRDGSLRQFGLGKRLNTVIPSWLLAILLGLFSYVISLYLLFSYSRRKYV